VTSAATEGQVFPFAFQKRYLPLLAGLGVTPKTARVTIGEESLNVRFGFLSCTSALSNISCVQLTGPYRAYRAIGARGSLADSGATFGTTTAGGVCVEFREPVSALDPTGLLTHEALTVTVADRRGFADALKRAAGLTGP
jgi:hypothetical protein